MNRFRFRWPEGVLTYGVDHQGSLLEMRFKDFLDAVDASSSDPVAAQLGEYFAGERKEFDLPLAPPGTDFQREVWAALVRIPYGQTKTYGELARQLGTPNGARAVGRANATNPIALVVPCHRVIGSSGDLTGFAYGVSVKRWLLDFESGSDVGGLFGSE